MPTIVKILAILVVALVAILVLAWVGLQIRPKSFAPFPQRSGEVKTVPLPTNLPAPVDRFYRQIYGKEVPVITSAVMTGRISVRPAGPAAFPGRFRIIHIAGQGYRHYIEAGLFGLPLMKVNERYLDGQSRMQLPFSPLIENNPKVNQGANLGLWAESAWLPSIFVTDSRVHWEPMDADTAILAVPFEGGQERFVVRFNAQSGLIDYFESMRYHGAESQMKTLWMNRADAWGTVNGYPLMRVGSAIWMDNGKPWAVFSVEDVVYNVDVGEYIRAEGE